MATTVVKGACPHDCPDTCAMLVTVEDGRATKVAGDPDHPFTQGFLCTKVNRYIERTYHSERLLRPLRRVGRKGEGRFEPISWDDALDEIASRLTSIARSPDGPQAILPYSYAGTMGYVQSSSMDRRFFHLLGASKLDRTICSMAGTVGMRMTVGANIGADGEGIPESDLVLLWGTNTLTSNPHLWPFILRGAREGRARDRDRSAAHAHGRAVRRLDRHSAGNRRSARARDDARPLCRRDGGPRLPREAHARRATAA